MPFDLRSPESRVATGRNIVAEQRRRVERQRILVAELEASRDVKVMREGHELLTQMVRNLDMMIENLKRIEAAHEEAASSQLEAV
jgi:hypothetical protein